MTKYECIGKMVTEAGEKGIDIIAGALTDVVLKSLQKICHEQYLDLELSNFDLAEIRYAIIDYLKSEVNTKDGGMNE